MKQFKPGDRVFIKKKSSFPGLPHDYTLGTVVEDRRKPGFVEGIVVAVVPLLREIMFTAQELSRRPKSKRKTC